MRKRELPDSISSYLHLPKEMSEGIRVLAAINLRTVSKEVEVAVDTYLRSQASRELVADHLQKFGQSDEI